MTLMSRTPSQPALTASQWFALTRSGAMTAQERAELDAWLAQPPNHAAFEAVRHAWNVLDAARDDPEMLALREAAERAHARPNRRLATGGAIAACLAGAVLLGWPAFQQTVAPNLPAQMGGYKTRTFSTGVGQMTTMTLPDGSVVTLDADTVLHMRETGRERLVTMERGRAFFRVAKDPVRPFSVVAGGKKVTATGTVFDVRLASDCFELVLVEGRVRVADQPGPLKRVQTAELDAGSRLTVAPEGRWAVTRVNVEKETSWLRGWLTYDRAPMGIIAQDINRYAQKQIVIRDAAVAATPMMGAFKPGDTEGFVKAAQFYGYAQVASETSDTIELVAP